MSLFTKALKATSLILLIQNFSSSTTHALDQKPVEHNLILQYGDITIEGAPDQKSKWGAFGVGPSNDMKMISVGTPYTMSGDKRIKVPVIAYFTINGDIKKSIQSMRKTIRIDIRNNSKKCKLNCDFKKADKKGKTYTSKITVKCNDQ